MFIVERYIVLKGKKIVKDYHTAQGMEGIINSLQNEKTDYDDIIKVPVGCECRINSDIREYNKNFMLNALNLRVNEGYIEIPEGHVLDGNKFRPMTMEEKVNTGKIQLDPYMKAVGDQVIFKTEDDLIADGIKTLEQINEEKLIAEDELMIAEEERKLRRTEAIARLGNKLKMVTA